MPLVLTLLRCGFIMIPRAIASVAPSTPAPLPPDLTFSSAKVIMNPKVLVAKGSSPTNLPTLSNSPVNLPYCLARCSESVRKCPTLFREKQKTVQRVQRVQILMKIPQNPMKISQNPMKTAKIQHLQMQDF